MSDDPDHPISRVLEDVEGGARPAEELLPLVYEELRALARARMQREPGLQTMQATALVHEAYLRVVGSRDPGWNSRGHFFCAAAQAMRRILVEQARRKGRVKHGGGVERVEFEPGELPAALPAVDVLAVDEALARLEAADARKAQLVLLRYFGGLTNEEAAAALGVSVGTIERDWRFIKAWLLTELGDAD